MRLIFNHREAEIFVVLVPEADHLVILRSNPTRSSKQSQGAMAIDCVGRTSAEFGDFLFKIGDFSITFVYSPGGHSLDAVRIELHRRTTQYFLFDGSELCPLINVFRQMSGKD